MMHDISINYLGDESILINPLYLKWSQLSFEGILNDIIALKNDLKAVEANIDNLAIVSYLSTLLRVVPLVM